MTVRFEASFAFQPIVDLETGQPFAYEALIRGLNNESAEQVFSQIRPERLHAFDRDARRHAVALAAALGLRSALSLNFLPQGLAVIPDAISSTVEAAAAAGIATEQLILEVSESEVIQDTPGFSATMSHWRGSGVRFAIDDFGAGYAGLSFLADFQPDIIKLDMKLVRDIDSRGPRQAIVKGVLQACTDLGLEVIAEGVETEAEFEWLRRHGVVLFQGYLFAMPLFESLQATSLVPSWARRSGT